MNDAERLDPMQRLLPAAARHGRFWPAVALVLLGLFGLGLVADMRNVARNGQIDLRIRVVGARVLLQGDNPYTYRWHPGVPTTLLDPQEYHLEMRKYHSTVTVTPTVLAFHAIAARLSYNYQKILWFGLEWLLLVGMVLLARSLGRDCDTRLMMIWGGVLFASTMFWRLHIERGQVYILFSFFAVFYIACLARPGKSWELLGGFILGILVCLRPQFGLLGIPLVPFRRYIGIAGVIAGLSAGWAVPAAIAPKVWPQFVESMAFYARPPVVKQAVVAPPSNPAEGLPTGIEGATNLRTYSIFGEQRTELRRSLITFGLSPPYPVFMGLLLAGILGWTIYLFRLASRGEPLEFCTARTLGLVTFAEIVQPIIRHEYSNTILLAVVLMIFATGRRPDELRRWEWALLFAAWCFSAPFPPWMSAGFRLNVVALVPPYAIMIWAFCVPWSGNRRDDTAVADPVR
jgi:hypothetical protein